VVDLFRGKKWDLVGNRNIWFAMSLAVILTGLYFWGARGLNYGIDFTGGGLVTYKLQNPVESEAETATLARAREAMTKAEVDARLQITGSATRKDQLLVRTRVDPGPGQDPDDVLTEQRAKMLPELSEPFPGIEEVAGEMVSPVVSEELIRNAIYAMAWGCLLTMARSVNTVLTVLLVLVAVYLLGGASLRTFTFALIVGMTAGGYSSIFTAAQLLVVLKNREERALVARRAARGRSARVTTQQRPVAARRSRVAPVQAAPEPAKQEQTAEAGPEPAEGMPEMAAPADDSSRARKLASRAARKKSKAGRKRKRRF